MNTKGSISISIIIAILLLSSLYIGISFTKSKNNLNYILDINKSSEDLIHDINSKERLFSLLNKNKSFVGKINYEDINKSFSIETIKEDYQKERIQLSKESNITFEINNETEVKIETTGNEYSLKLLYNDEDVLKGAGNNLHGNKVITIDKDQIYKKNKNIINYGTYKLIVSGDAEVTIQYNKLIERLISIKGDNFNKNVIIAEDYIEYED